MKNLLIGVAALAALGSAEVATAQTTVHQGPHGTTVVTRQRDGDKVVRKFNYGGRQWDRVRGNNWVAPHGWTYRRYGVGAFLPSFFLGSTYYVDPGSYGFGLQAAGPNRHWIRVGSDLYLVNNRGRVIQVVPDVYY